MFVVEAVRDLFTQGTQCTTDRDNLNTAQEHVLRKMDSEMKKSESGVIFAVAMGKGQHCCYMNMNNAIGTTQPF